jgi:processive 1,2-diacylglycerol beta-glucosyltransferase
VDDQDYYIDLATLDMFEQHGADPQLLEVLRRALGSRQSMELRWSRS